MRADRVSPAERAKYGSQNARRKRQAARIEDAKARERYWQNLDRWLKTGAVMKGGIPYNRQTSEVFTWLNEAKAQGWGDYAEGF